MQQGMPQADSEQVFSREAFQAPKHPAIVRGAEFALLAAVVAGFVETLRFAASYVSLPFAVNFAEGVVLSGAARAADGLTPYPPIGHPPYVVNIYGPVFYYALAPLVRWFGLEFTAPRLFVIASGLAVAFFLILLLRHWTESWVVALGFGLCFLGVPLIRHWIYVLRVDLFGLALTLAGLYVFTIGKRSIWPALLFLAALYTKVTFLAAPVACILYLILSGERRRTWRFLGWLLLFGFAGLVVLGLGTKGRALIDMFMTQVDPYRLSFYISRIRAPALQSMALVAGAVALAVNDIRKRRISLPLLYFILACVTSLTAGIYGGDGNHLLEWQAALVLAAGCGYHSLRARRKVDAAVALIPIGVIATVLLALPRSRQLSPALLGCPAAYRFAAEQPGQLLTDNPGIAVLSGKTIWLNDAFEFSLLRKAGRLDQQPLIDMVRQKFFGVILLGEDLPSLEGMAAQPSLPSSTWSPNFVSELRQNYHSVARFSCAYASVAYEPNQASGSARGR